MNGIPVSIKQEGNIYVVELPMQQAGEVRFDFYYDGNKQTHANCLVINNAERINSKTH